MKRVALTVIGIFALASLMFPVQSFANYSSQISWELIVISSKPACSGYHYYMTEKYYDISAKYLELYQLDNESYTPQCMTESEYLTEYEKPHDLDLIILVYDREKGRADLHSQNTGGIYIHEGDDLSRNHTIIFCDCPNFEYSDPVWILSHELSHFVLNRLGFDLNIAERNIHLLDEKFDYCVEVQYSEDCSSVKTRLETNRGSWAVMAPYEPAIGKTIPEPNPENAVFDSTYQKEIALEFTKWWLKGDISNENYLKGLQILSGKEAEDSIESLGVLAESPMVVLSEPPNWVATEHNNEYLSDVQSLLTSSPFNGENERLTSEEEQSLILWLREKADSWSQNQIEDDAFLTDLEYLLNSKKPDMYLRYIKSLSAEELINKGMEFQKAGEIRNAISYFDYAIIRSIDQGSIDVNALILKGSALAALQQYEDALIYLDNAIDAEPESTIALKKKAFVLAQLGDLEEARTHFELAQQIENG